MVDKLARLDAHHRIYISVAAAGLIALGLSHHQLATRSLAAYDGFAAVSLALVWITIFAVPRDAIRDLAREQDLSRKVIFVLVIAAACAALFAVAFLIRDVKGEPHHVFNLRLALGIGTVVLSWLIVHTTFALRYAHSFYGVADPSHRLGGGLEFPGEQQPAYPDFAYFSFVIGMTCQVSDVQITSRSLRQLALVHGVLSFAFNTVILALTINIISGLL